MKFDKLSVVVGGAILIVIAAYIVLQYVKSLPANKNAPLVPSSQNQNVTPTSANRLPTGVNSVHPTQSQSANIVVTAPQSNQTVSPPFDVKGQARVFESQINYRVKDSLGNIMIEGTAMAQAPDSGQFGNFSFTVSGISQKGKATLEVFDYSAKDGSEIDKVSIPLNIK